MQSFRLTAFHLPFFALLALLVLPGSDRASAFESREWMDFPPSSPAAVVEGMLGKNAATDQRLRNALEDAAKARRAVGNALPRLEIYNPLPQGVYPPDLAAPRMVWEPDDAVRSFVLHVDLPGGGEAAAVTRQAEWTPSPALWNEMTRRARGGKCRFTVTALDGEGTALACARLDFGVAEDPLDAAIVYQQIPLPFLHAQDNPQLTRWLVADPSADEQPRVLLSGMNHCGNCHTFSADARTFGMDIDYEKDKGGYVLTDVSERIVVDEKAMISWNDYRPEDGVTSMGLFTKLSPDGSYALTTVKEKSMFSPLDDVEFCQFFYPIRGHLAYYDRAAGVTRALPGADSEAHVQTSPAWSPDGKRIAFARAPLDERLIAAIGDRKFLPQEGRVIEDFNRQYPYRYDLYVMDFNQGRGGKPRPLAGASNNGASNYFPRFSPDGEWIVFCRSETGLVLQPGSELWIVPARGGEARRLECNTHLLNSWHSFSPNGRWLLFSSKRNSPYTQVFAAHLDDNGHASRPVLLDRLAHPELASIIPEAVDRSVLRIRGIELARP